MYSTRSFYCSWKRKKYRVRFLSTYEWVGIQPKTKGIFVESTGFSCPGFLKLSSLFPQLSKMAGLYSNVPVCVQVHRLFPGTESLGDGSVPLACVSFLRKCNPVPAVFQYLNIFVSCTLLSCFLSCSLQQGNSHSLIGRSWNALILWISHEMVPVISP